MASLEQTIGGPKRAFVGYGSHPPKVVWPGEAKVALNFVVAYEEGSEYSLLEGDGRNEGLGEINYQMSPEHRDLAMESGYEYGSRVGIWRLLRLLDEYAIKVTFYACALADLPPIVVPVVKLVPGPSGLPRGRGGEVGSPAFPGRGGGSRGRCGGGSGCTPAASPR